ncbi:hypothetical protein C0991_005021, partial [Blastosporella zonata]
MTPSLSSTPTPATTLPILPPLPDSPNSNSTTSSRSPPSFSTASHTLSSLSGSCHDVSFASPCSPSDSLHLHLPSPIANRAEPRSRNSSTESPIRLDTTSDEEEDDEEGDESSSEVEIYLNSLSMSMSEGPSIAFGVSMGRVVFSQPAADESPVLPLTSQFLLPSYSQSQSQALSLSHSQTQPPQNQAHFQPSSSQSKSLSQSQSHSYAQSQSQNQSQSEPQFQSHVHGSTHSSSQPQSQLQSQSQAQIQTTSPPLPPAPAQHTIPLPALSSPSHSHSDVGPSGPTLIFEPNPNPPLLLPATSHFSPHQLLSSNASLGPISSSTHAPSSTSLHDTSNSNTNLARDNDPNFSPLSTSSQNATSTQNLSDSADPDPDPTGKTPNVYINGLPPHFPEDQLYALAAPFGAVRSVRTFTRHVRDSESGYGFVLFEKVGDAEKCIVSLRRYRNLHPTFSKQAHKIPGTRPAPPLDIHLDTPPSWDGASEPGEDGLVGGGSAAFKAKMESLHDRASTNLYMEG